MPCSLPRVVLLAEWCHLGVPVGLPVVEGVRVSAFNPAPQCSTGVRRGTTPAPVVILRSSPSVSAPVEVSAPEVALSPAVSLFLGWSRLSGLAPVEVMNSAVVRSETIPLVADGALESSLAAVSATLARATRSVTLAKVAGSVTAADVAGSANDPKVARSFSASDVV